MINPIPWRLYGTLGCHLCEQAEQLLLQLQDARPIAWQSVDIADLPLDQQQVLATKIPLLHTEQATLKWPFGLADLLRLV